MIPITKTILALTAVTGLILWNVGNTTASRPPYELIQSQKQPFHFEVRQYGNLVAATVNKIDLEVKLNRQLSDDEFTSQGFKALAGYIGVMGQPQNISQTKIDMTAPVVSEKIDMTAPVYNNGETIAFILPAQQYSEASQAPIPTNSVVKIQQVQPEYHAVYMFNGNTDINKSEKQAQELLQRVNTLGYSPKTYVNTQNSKTTLEDVDWKLAQYNPPWTLPLLKENEVHIILNWN